jgi:cytochrome c oxidase subunit 2
MKRMLKRLLTLAPLIGCVLITSSAATFADGYQARSSPWQIWFQPPMSPTAQMVYDFNVLLMWIEGAIVLFVLGLMVYIVIKFNRKANPTPSKTTHNALLEVTWTVVPVLILVGIAVPSMKTLYFTDKTKDVEMTLKVIGNQWYWSYEYPDHNDMTFDSVMIPDDELEKGQPRLLSVDNPVVLPAKTNIRLLLASNDVIHNWAIPSLSLKLDNVPGRVNETWTHINQPGDYYGMCSELCGVSHSGMPIHIRALSKENFAKWLVRAKVEFASNDIQKKQNAIDSSVRIAQVVAKK